MNELPNRVIAILLVVLVGMISLQFSVYYLKYGGTTFMASAVGIVSLCVDNDPQLIDIPPQTAFVNTPFYYDVDTNIENDSNVRFQDDTHLFNIENYTGEISFTPAEGDVGTHYVNISVFSSCNRLSDNEIMTLNIENENRAPELDPIPDFIINQSDPFSYDVNATDPDGDNLTFGDNFLLFQINSMTGLIYFVPQQMDVGNHSDQIWVMDEHGALDWETVDFEIIDVNDPPVLDTIGAQTAIIYENYTYDVNATDADVKPEWSNLTFSDNSPFFNISNETGMIEFYVNETLNGTYSITIYVSDGEFVDQETVSFSVVFVNHAPNITSWYPENETVRMKEGEYQYFNITKFDLDGTIPSVQWYIDGEPLSGAIGDEYNFYASYSSSGVRDFEVVITDGNLTDSHEWTLEIENVERDTGGAATPTGATAQPACVEDWRCTEWSVCPVYEIQTRECVDVNKCGTDFYKPEESRSCVYVPEPTCSDGIVNCHDGLCEIWIDCGGPCPPCPTCDDGIRNCHTMREGDVICEEEVDCGGPCPPCTEADLYPVCGDGVCEPGEYLCFSDCTFFLGQFLLAVIILGAGSVFVYRAYAILAVAYRKSKPAPYTNLQLLGASTLRKLHLLQIEMGRKKMSSMTSEFSVVMRDFFRKRFDIRKRFTYVELAENVRNKGIDRATSSKVSDLCVKMTEMEYRHLEPSRGDMLFVIKSAIVIVEKLTGVRMYEALGEHAEGELKKAGPPEKKTELPPPKAETKKRKAEGRKITADDRKSMEKVKGMISEGERAIAGGDVEKAEKIYGKIRTVYDSLPEKAKKSMYKETVRIIKLYNEIMKGISSGEGE